MSHAAQESIGIKMGGGSDLHMANFTLFRTRQGFIPSLHA